MDYEKKYKEALEKARKIHNDTEFDYEKGMMEEIFQELKETEDEKVKRILHSISSKISFHLRDIFTEEEFQCFDVWSNAWLEKQGEQKTADKVEPKFKVGNWYQCTKDFFGKGVTFDKNTAYYCAKEGCLQNEYGCHIAIVKDLYDNFKLWDISDAKDGDVLAESKGDVILMFRGIGNTEWNDVIDYYCCYDRHRKKFIFQKDLKFWGCVENNQLKPATKEQRGILFAKIKEAGYKWYSENKKLKKTEQKPTWSEEDEHRAKDTIYFLDTAKKHYASTIELDACIDWIKYIKQRIKE